MALVMLESYDKIAILRMTKSVTNANGLAMLDDLMFAFKKIKDCYKGVVLGGGNKFFLLDSICQKK